MLSCTQATGPAPSACADAPVPAAGLTRCCLLHCLQALEQGSAGSDLAGHLGGAALRAGDRVRVRLQADEVPAGLLAQQDALASRGGARALLAGVHAAQVA
jgi:hypothetical protein